MKIEKYQEKKMSFLEPYIAELSLVEKEMLSQAIERETWLLKFFADRYKAPEAREKAVEKRPSSLEHAFNLYKTLQMCLWTDKRYPYALEFVSV